METSSRKYDTLYLTILEIGSECLSTGIKYNELIEILKGKGYDTSNDCIEIAIKTWFTDSFWHRGSDDNKYNGYDDLENHLDCNFILKGESCLKLLSYHNSMRSLAASRIARIIAIISIGISIGLFMGKMVMDGIAK